MSFKLKFSSHSTSVTFFFFVMLLPTYLSICFSVVPFSMSDSQEQEYELEA